MCDQNLVQGLEKVLNYNIWSNVLEYSIFSNLLLDERAIDNDLCAISGLVWLLPICQGYVNMHLWDTRPTKI